MPRKPGAGEGFFNGFIVDSRPFMQGVEFAMYERVDQQNIGPRLTVTSGLNLYPATWLTATVSAHGIPVRGVKRDKVNAVAARLADLSYLKALMEGLSSEELATLALAVDSGGLIKYQRISRKFGDETEDTYFWSSRPPKTTIGHLRMLGLLHVGRRQMGQRRDKVLVVPSDLRDALTIVLEPLKPEISAAKSAKSAKSTATERTLYELEVTLSHIEPRIWRLFTVPSTISLFELHRAILAAMGWYGGHHYEFRAGRRIYADPVDGVNIVDSADVTLAEVAKGQGSHLQYTYDFGDNWLHEVKLRAIRPPESAEPMPRLLDGARACPPEDVGGVPGYAAFLAGIADPDHPSHESMLDWVGGAWDSEHFDRQNQEAALIHVAEVGGWASKKRYEPRPAAPGTAAE